MHAAESRGDVPKGTAKRWAKHTPNIKALPEKKTVEQTKKQAAVLAIVKNLFKQADATLAPAPAPAQPQPGAPTGQPGGASQPRKADQIAKEIGALHPKHRGTAAYHRLQRAMPGSLRGFAAASQPAARQNFAAAFGSGGGDNKEADVKPQFDKVSPFMAGMLRGCADAQLDEAGTLQVLLKTAQRNDEIGKDVRGFLELIPGL